MKKTLVKRFAILLCFFMMATQLTSPVYAITGACSGHDGVDCSAGADTDGSVICSDGWTDSSVDYTSMREECGIDYVESNNPAPALYDSLGDDSVVATEPTELSKNVDKANVVDVVSEDVTGTSITTAGALVEEAVDEVLDSLEGETQSGIIAVLENVETDIVDEISNLTNQMETDTENQYEYRLRIRHLQNLMLQLRAQSIKRHEGLMYKLRRLRNLRTIYLVRWGNLDTIRQKCMGITMEELKDALATGTVPESCETNKIEYSGSISVDQGALNMYKEILFESNDSITTSSVSAIAFNSVIAGHWDGMIIQYTPASDDDSQKEVNVTISIGDLNETYTASQVLGRKSIGDGYYIEIKRLAHVLPGVPILNMNNFITNKLKLAKKISMIRNQIQNMRLMNRGGEGVDDIEELINELDEYTLDSISSEEAEVELNEIIVSGLTDTETVVQITNRARLLRQKLAEIKLRAKIRKFEQKLIPFKDTDDNTWYTGYVANVRNRNIISGYKDATGNELGEFRPANNITVAEILKIALETSGKGQSSGTPALQTALNHWAKGYVRRSEELGLDIVNNDVDLSRPATRGEVVRIFLEALEINPDEITSTSFSDLPLGHKHAAYIEFAKALGIVSGDAGTSNFRPDALVNRAEASKIANQILEIVLGGVNSIITETVGGDEPWD
jgi:hypothetical protein